MQDAKPENVARWDGRRGWYEVWYATTNHTPSGRGFWFRYTFHVPPDPDAEGEATLWGFVFSPDGPVFAAKRDRPMSEARLGDMGIIQIGDALLAEGQLSGSLTDAEGRVLTWDLAFEPTEQAVSPLPRALRRVAPSFYSNPNLDVKATGTITVDSETVELAGERLGQSHVWGRHHAGAWAWMHLHVDEDFTIEAIQARPHLPVPFADRLPARPFVLARFGDHHTTFGGLGSHKVRGRFAFPLWHLSCTGPDLRLAITARAAPERFVQVTYHDPDGAEAYCANTEVADAVVEVYRRYGKLWRPTEIHEIPGRAHVEFGARSPYPGVPVVF